MSPVHLIIIIAALGVGLGLGYSLYKKDSATVPTAEEIAAKPEKLDRLPDFSYPDLQGNSRSSQEWGDKIVVLNFWASWCPPCRKETPAFIEVQSRYPQQVQFVGIAIDDKGPVEDFADTYGINYPTLLGDMSAIEISRQLGNRFSGLPFTAIFDQGGKLIYQQTGEVKKAELIEQIKALL
ncbi:MAG: TlpA family protein disulfide reductase [Gammaproteobacteria bacterium]|nr:TlpA family protein disulfide reductase [Gammaproteobacteria bacterium]NNJ91485.1 TlpA family protein disulfide reductase [Gammaproteobacteria bacterium]